MYKGCLSLIMCHKGTLPIRKIDFFRALPKLPLPPPPPNSGKLYNFFWTSKTTFLRVSQNQVTMITTMMWVIIVIMILVLLLILVLKMTKKYHLTWYWGQNIRGNMVGKKDKKIRARPSPPLFGQCPKEIDFCYGRCSLSARSCDRSIQLFFNKPPAKSECIFHLHSIVIHIYESTFETLRNAG